MRKLLLAGAMVLAGANAAKASFVATFSEVGSSVVATGVGSLIVTTPFLGQASTYEGGYVFPGSAQLGLGSFGFQRGTEYAINLLTSFRSFGAGPGAFANAGSGDLVAFYHSLGVLFLVLPPNYVSGSPLSDTSTYLNSSLASLGLTPGTYNYSYGPNVSTVLDTFTVQIGSTSVPISVPEPTSVALLGVGIAGIAMARRLRAG